MAGKLRKHGIWSVLVPVDVIMAVLLILLAVENSRGMTTVDSVVKVGAVVFAILLTVGLLTPFGWRLWLGLKKSAAPTASVEVKIEN